MRSTTTRSAVEGRVPGTGQPGGEPRSRGPRGGSGRITILIVDPHGPMREALATILAAEPDFSVIASVPGLDEALGIVRRRRPWVTLVDLAAVGEPVADGFAALRDTRPATVILARHRTS
jgi:DNA-binding NarL/FixJ family response regulator